MTLDDVFTPTGIDILNRAIFIIAWGGAIIGCLLVAGVIVALVLDALPVKTETYLKQGCDNELCPITWKCARFQLSQYCHGTPINLLNPHYGSANYCANFISQTQMRQHRAVRKFRR